MRWRLNFGDAEAERREAEPEGGEAEPEPGGITLK